MDDVPAMFAPRWTANALVLRLHGGEGAPAALAWSAAVIWTLPALFDGRAGIATAVHVVFAALLTARWRLVTELELNADAVRVRRRLGPLVVGRSDMRLSEVETVELNAGLVADGVVVLRGRDRGLRIDADGHPPEAGEWLRAALTALAAAASDRGDDRPPVPEALRWILRRS
jgi:hypothetical protein